VPAPVLDASDVARTSTGEFAPPLGAIVRQNPPLLPVASGGLRPPRPPVCRCARSRRQRQQVGQLSPLPRPSYSALGDGGIGVDAAEFIEKWRSTPLPERAAAQQHFLELCELLGVEKPPTTGPETADYRFEAPVIGADDRPGFADAFRRTCFGWEYKKRRARRGPGTAPPLRWLSRQPASPRRLRPRPDRGDHEFQRLSLAARGVPP
jgi:hypothetical protein